jgi:hypothetical protein
MIRTDSDPRRNHPRRLHSRPAPDGAPDNTTGSGQAFLIDGTPPPTAVRASEAARGFSAGNGYIPGLIVDRLA